MRPAFCNDAQVKALLGPEALESTNQLLKRINQFNAIAPEHLQLDYVEHPNQVQIRFDTLPRDVKLHLGMLSTQKVLWLDDYR